MYWLAKYGVQTSFQFSMIKRGVVDLAATADWTPVNADSKISQNGANVGATTNTVVAIAGTGSVAWSLTLTASELTTPVVYVQIVDAATKAVEDNSFVIYTYGHASAKIAADLGDQVRLGLLTLPNAAAEAAGGMYTRGTGAGQINQPANGMVDGNVVRWLNTAVATPTTAGIPRVAIEAAGDFIQAAADKVWASATRTLTAFSLALAQSVWDVLAASVVAASSIGLQIKTNLDAAITTRLAPTVAARTLGVNAAGQAGIDWANVGAPTTAVALTATTIATSQVVASVSGAVGSVTGNVGGNVTGSVGSVTGAVGSVTGNVGGNVTGSVGSVAANGVSNASLAADTGLKPIRSGTAQAGSTSTTLVLDAGASATDDFYNNSLVVITGGLGIAQTRRIRDYTGSSKTALITRAWSVTPDNTSTFAILANVSGWDEFVADHTTAATFGATTGQSLSTSELIDNLVGPLATVQANGANTATVFQIDISTVTEAAANWWVDAWLSFDLTSALAGQVKKITAFNQTTGMVTVASAYTAIPTATNTARIVTR